MFGAGGSALLVPILVYVLHMPVKVALGMALLILVLTGLLASLAHSRSGNTNWKVALQWSALGVVGAYLGGRVAGFIPPIALISAFAAVILASSASMLRTRRPASADYRSPGTGASTPVWKMMAVGLMLGFFTGMVGAGGGFLLVPALVLICGVDMKQAIGTSLLIIAINSVGGFLGFAAHTEFPVALTTTIAGFAAVGSLVGERLGKPLPSHRLRPAFAVFLLVIGTMMIIHSALDVISGHAL